MIIYLAHLLAIMMPVHHHQCKNNMLRTKIQMYNIIQKLQYEKIRHGCVKNTFFNPRHSR